MKKKKISRYNMRMIIRIFLLNLVGSLCFVQRVYANHAAGGELIYQWVSDSTYRIIFKFYRDCAGPEAPDFIYCCYRNSCNPSAAYSVPLIALTLLPDGSFNGHELSPGCPGYPTTCDDLNSTLPGYQEWWYSALVTLPYKCNYWTFSVEIVARNYTITNIVPTPDLSGFNAFAMYLETTLNNQDGQGSSSPYFTIKPVPYVCINEPYAYNNGVIDPNGDSLSFKLMHSLADDGNCPPAVDSLPFASPSYNLITNPISCNNTFQFNSLTGQMNYTPDMQQRAVTTFRVEKYRNGILLGTVMRDVQVVVLPCTDPPPQFTLDTATISGGNYVNGIINTCLGNNLQFCFQTVSTAVGAILTSITNADSSMPGAQVTYANLRTDSFNTCVNWAPTPQQTGLHILAFTVTDSACRPPGIMITRAFAIPVYVYPTLQGMPDTTICAGAHATLHVTGGNTFTWSVLNGDTNSLSCTNCAQPQAQPNETTTYEVKNNYFNTISCKTADTVTVNVVRVPSIDTTISKCKKDIIQLPIDLNGTDSADYHFLWSPSSYLSSDTAMDPLTFTPVDMNYVVAISTDAGISCSTADTVRIQVADKFLHTSDTGICPGDTINIYATGGQFYHWKPDANTYISDTAIATPRVSPQTDWSYIVYGENSSGCLDTAAANVKVFPNAVVQLPDSVILYYGESYPFSPLTNCTTFNWFPPQGLSADDISNPVASPEANTQYTVTGTTERGCTVKTIVNVYRDDDVLLTLPNAFAPGMGENKLLKPIYRGNVILDYLRIFNRWGQMVYESNDLNQGWDGSWHGTPQAEGVYVYAMHGHTVEGNVLTKQGNITLIR